MNPNTSRTMLFILYLLLGSLATAQSEDRSSFPYDFTVEDHMRILELEHAGPPEILTSRREVLFTYQPESVRDLVRSQGYGNQLSVYTTAPSRIFIAFGHEQYRELHAMDRSPTGVYFFFMDYSIEFQRVHRTVEYRFVVDGVWMNDPLNPAARTLITGTSFSQVYLPPAPAVPDRTPILNPSSSGVHGREVRFVLEAPSGREIFLSGSFNSWDPFIHRMRERPDFPGVYELDIHLLPGTYYYQFVSGGQRSLDPLNGEFGTSSEGVVYSRVTVPR